jgi:hypothetical protein
MSWVYLDDRFFSHPKVVRAGGDAGWLFLAGLAFCNGGATDGHIPKGVVARLTDRKSPKKLAQILCDVELWHDEGDDYIIHDYVDWNRTAIRKKEQATRAARARWDAPRTDAGAMPEQCGSICSGNAGAMLTPTPTPLKSKAEHFAQTPDSLALVICDPPAAATPLRVTPATSSSFERFWEAYPRKVSKQHAAKAWRKAVPNAHTVVVHQILASLEAWNAYWQADGTDPKFIPYPASWLAKRHWLEDDPVAAPSRVDERNDLIRRAAIAAGAR